MRETRFGVVKMRVTKMRETKFGVVKMGETKMKETKQWYYGTRLGKWYLAYPSEVPAYKRREGITRSEMKRIGRAKAKEKVLAPRLMR